MLRGPIRVLVAGLLSFFVVVAVAGCGSSSNSSSSGGGSGGPNAPTPGSYLWQSGITGQNLSIAAIGGDGSVGAPVPTNVPASHGFPGFVLSPSKRHLFTLDSVSDRLRVLVLTGPGVAADDIQGSPFSVQVGALPEELTIDPAGRFLYVVENSTATAVEQFSVDNNSGSLTHASLFTEGFDLRSPVVHPSGKFLFVVDAGPQKIFVSAIGSNGLASPGTPFLVDGIPLRSVLDSSGRFLFASLSAGGIAAFAVDASTGALNKVPGSPFPTANFPANAIVTPAGFLYLSDAVGVEGFKVDGTTGVLTPVPGSPFTFAVGAFIAADPTGQFLYLASGGGIYGYRIDASTGSLTALAGSPFPGVPYVTFVKSTSFP